jgi:nucleotide-binding universal stress UspA family protein
MFRHILVPLDGSEFAESALPVALFAAKRFGARLTLFHVLEREAPDLVGGQRHLADLAGAELYLKSLAEGLVGAARADWHVHEAATDDVASSIVEHYGEFDYDLVVMCARGSGGLEGIAVGSIAGKVIDLGEIPVLLVRPKASAAGDFAGFSTIFAALDNASLHDAALDEAAAFARRAEAKLVLLSAVPTLSTLSKAKGTPATLLPSAARLLLEMETEELREHLDEHVAALARAGIRAEAKVVRGDPARAIAKAVDASEGSLLVMGTHGKIGMRAFWSGSVASKAVAFSKASVLLVPIKD